MRKKSGGLAVQLSLAMTLLVIFAGVMIFRSQYGQSMPSPWMVAGAVVAALWYVVTRIRIYLVKREQRLL